MKLYKKLNYIILTWILELSNVEVKEDGKIDFAVGGQAVIEGVMMRSPNSMTIAVRKNNGDVKLKKDYYKTLTQKFKALNIVILRGVINLFEMMVVGTKAINYSANESLDYEEEVKASGKASIWMKIGEALMFGFSLVLALAFSLFLFKFVPLGITTFLDGKFSFINNHYVVFNIIDGILKTSIFLLYVYFLTLVPSFKRVFQYHGAEHKSIFTYENNLELIPENAKKQSRFHPRCGTSFIVIVFAISIIFYTFLPKQDSFIQNFMIRAAFLPLVAGISYEVLRISAKHQNNKLVKAFIAPGLGFQRLTTQEPNEKQLEVGLRSLEGALEMEKELS